MPPQFQFLLVRLKAFPDNRTDLSYLFQFLLVRLKALSILITYAGKYISIPFGAIKR